MKEGLWSGVGESASSVSSREQADVTREEPC